MMNRLTISKGRALAHLILLFLFVLQGCRKDIIQPNAGVLRNSLSVAEAKAYFDANFKQASQKQSSNGNNVITADNYLTEKQPIWNQAYQKMLSTGSAVKMPIDFGDAYALVNPKTNEIMPLSSLNYLFMYKDSVQAIHVEWVILVPDSAWLYGNRHTYTGRILVKDWNGKIIRNLSYKPIGAANTSSSIKSKLLSLNGKSPSAFSPKDPMGDAAGFCHAISSGKCPRTGVCSKKCDMCLAICAKISCEIFDCSPICDLPEDGDPTGGGSGGGGSGGDGGGGGGGGGQPKSPGREDYPPDDCVGGGGQLPKTPRTDEPQPDGIIILTPPCIPTPTQKDYTFMVKFMGITDPDKQNFLFGHKAIYDALVNYVVTNGSTPENLEFVDWATGYLMENPATNLERFIKDVFLGPDQSFNDSDADNNYASMNLTDVGKATFSTGGYDIYTSTANLSDYGPNHPVSQAIFNFNPWVYYAFVGANNTSIAHFHLTTKGLDLGDGYRKAIGAIGEGLFVSRITSIPTSPPANVFIGKMLGTTHIDALVVRNIPFINGSGYEIAINYTDINGNNLQQRMHHPDGLKAFGFIETTISYEVKTLNAQANTPESLYKMFQEGVKQVRHRANIPYMSASVLVFDDQAWNKLRNSSYGSQAVNDINNLSLIKNSDGEQKIYFRIEKGLSKDANRAFFALKNKITGL